jgi:hypothetical protein
LWILAAVAALAVLGGLVAVLARGPATSSTSASVSAGKVTEITQDPWAGAGADAGADPGVGAAVARPAPAPNPEANPASDLDAGADGLPPRRPEGLSRRARRQVDAHLRAAEDARRAGNGLKQMAEADSALRLDPKNRRAAYLLGDALVPTDRARGCRYLRRAGRLGPARAVYRRAGCGRTD